VVINKTNRNPSNPRNLLQETIIELNKFKIPRKTVSSEKTVIHLRAVGDIMLGRSVATQMQKKHDWNWSFLETMPHLSPVDLTIANLETPIITNRCPYTTEGMQFCAPAQVVEGLANAHIQVVSLANNHTTNYGQTGLAETKQILSNAHIVSVGNFETTIKEIQGIKIGIIGLDDTSRPINQDQLYQVVNDLKSRTDITMVVIHWGDEYQPTPNERQKMLAQSLINSGVSIIIGSHPHVLQPIEVSGNTLIAYSLGNFIFDQMWSEETRKGLILDMDLTFDKQNLQSIDYQPIHTTIYDYGQPRIDDKQ
jgi:poly-gamma-glutamate synthesis protein (capsule biosynthesis protein)